MRWKIMILLVGILFGALISCGESPEQKRIREVIEIERMSSDLCIQAGGIPIFTNSFYDKYPRFERCQKLDHY